MTEFSKPIAASQIDDFALAKNYATDYAYVLRRRSHTGRPSTSPFSRARVAAIRSHGRPELLEVGCGSVVHHVLPAVPYVSAIDMCDFRDDNLEEIHKWRDDDEAAHDWRRATKFVLQQEQAEAH